MAAKRPASPKPSGSSEPKRQRKTIPEKIPGLSEASVRMRDRRKVEEIIESMRLAGSSTLQVISDFDMTLTRFAYNGTRCPTCHSILDNSVLISADCKKMLRDLLNKYYPIEFDASLTVEEKVPHMVDWWTKAHELLIEQKIQKDQLARVVKDSNAMLREDCKSFFKHLQEKCIPLVIFSAGIGDVLEEIIKQAGVSHSNIMVFSNYMDFDEMGTLQAFKGKLIHTFNKNGLTLVESSHFPKLRDRRNVLLLGDTLGDLNMVDGLPNTDNILKIGFLNDKVEQCRESYLNRYDIVLEEDETMKVPNADTKHQSRKLSLQMNSRHSFGLTCIKDVLYSIGGHGNFSPGFKDVSVYEPEQDKWHNLESAPKILRDVKAVSVEDRYVWLWRPPTSTTPPPAAPRATRCETRWPGRRSAPAPLTRYWKVCHPRSPASRGLPSATSARTSSSSGAGRTATTWTGRTARRPTATAQRGSAGPCSRPCRSRDAGPLPATFASHTASCTAASDTPSLRTWPDSGTACSRCSSCHLIPETQ